MKLFVPKTHGYGATPRDWRGWLVILAFAAAEALAAWWLMTAMPPRIWLFIAVSLGLAILLIVVTRATTEGQWRWRWGGKD